ncbi:hypothetical protein FACS1894122_14880 [Alphaproteobacteria bacterium]|nr:hypothetical protein FACS1894122_14880 [Alphaproteobacteria bacterium]
MKHNIPDEIFQKIYGFLVTVGGIHTKNEGNVRIFLEAVYYLLRTLTPQKPGLFPR